MEDELRCVLALHRVPGVGPVLFQKLIARFGTAAAVLAAGSMLKTEGRLTESVIASLAVPDWAAVDADLEWGQRSGNLILMRDDPRYPHLLSQISDPPPVLFVRGEPAVLKQPQIAIVGTRNPSTVGRDTARSFAHELATFGLVVTSGLAYGIDGAGHEGALEAGGGLTVAVAGTGLDRVYPARHRDLAHRIVERGALVSEYPPGTPPLAANFPRRNRIISGLSVGTLVVEAAIHSGSLITARLALEQGREVFAIPGSIYNPLARGCHALLREGAKLVETAQDIQEELTQLTALVTASAATSEKESSLDDDYRKLLECFGYDPLPIDTLVERSGLTSANVSSMLLILELRELVALQPGGLYTRAM
ncbi:protein Smf [Gammaproteobacteria bacterium]